ncbi:MAG: hypothetical protein EXS05_01650 [Planctomycetaceae bacterium]|nr:hypothetical protein [Planctomycetaceae bacterium]
MKSLLSVLVTAAVVCGTSARAWALGEETFGSEPLNEANFTDWPGVMPLVNNQARVYHTWVNGNEHCYYQGDVAALNEALKQFAAIKADKHEVVLRPGPIEATTFHRDKQIPYRWSLNLIGGIAKHMTTLEKGDKIWTTSPVLTVYIDNHLPLDKLAIPDTVTAVGLTELKARYTEALTSSDITVRGWGSGALVGLDRYDAKTLATVVALLDDSDNWVRLNVAHSLPTYGAKAKSALDALRKAEATEDAALKQAVAEAIAAIETSQPQTEAEHRHADLLDQIEKFVKSQKTK